ncbi:MAG TPA: peptide deformylase [Ruminococcaceae bacterium]|jgi:peptide deformylase|nr:peptide deformylase [Oscillospiraceae bacterium]
MALRNILTKEDRFLLKKCRPVEKFDGRLAQLLDDLAETMYSDNGAGLAAIQVGILRRAVVVDAGDGLKELVNPVILEASGEQEGPEGCLSFPGEWGIVKRPKHVKVRAQDRNGKTFECEGDDLLARAFCHEIDHLDGILFPSRASRMLTVDEIKEIASKGD